MVKRSIEGAGRLLSTNSIYFLDSPQKRLRTSKDRKLISLQPLFQFMKETKTFEVCYLLLDQLRAHRDGRLDRVRVHRLRRLLQTHRVQVVLHVLKLK